jgi:hypothetical protein
MEHTATASSAGTFAATAPAAADAPRRAPTSVSDARCTAGAPRTPLAACRRFASSPMRLRFASPRPIPSSRVPGNSLNIKSTDLAAGARSIPAPGPEFIHLPPRAPSLSPPTAPRDDPAGSMHGHVVPTAQLRRDSQSASIHRPASGTGPENTHDSRSSLTPRTFNSSRGVGTLRASGPSHPAGGRIRPADAPLAGRPRRSGLSPTIPQKCAGTRIRDPPPCRFHTAGRAERRAPAAARPCLDPPGVRSPRPRNYVRPVTNYRSP